VFWHRAEISDMEPHTMCHLVHCLYTGQLHPDFITHCQLRSSCDASCGGHAQVNKPRVQTKNKVAGLIKGIKTILIHL